MNLWISEEALYDIEEARSYYFGTSVENLKRRFREQLIKGLQYISSNPLELALKYRNIRTYNLKIFPYQIHYLYEDDKVMLMGVFHGKSDPQSWEDRIIK